MEQWRSLQKQKKDGITEPHNMESMLQEEELKSLSFKKLLFLKTKRTSHLRHSMGHVTL